MITIKTKTIINNLNLIFKTKDINHLNKPTYTFLNMLSGFIAHYDIGGFKGYYEDLRLLINDLKDCSDILNPDYYLSDFFNKDKDYYDSKATTLKQIKPLLNKYESDINIYFNGLEKQQDIQEIKNIMLKNNLSINDLNMVGV